MRVHVTAVVTVMFPVACAAKLTGGLGGMSHAIFARAATRLILTQPGLEPCGFCRGDECIVQDTIILQDCVKSTPCTDTPVVCPFCAVHHSLSNSWHKSLVRAELMKVGGS